MSVKIFFCQFICNAKYFSLILRRILNKEYILFNITKI